ncbi:hypothetical protein FKW77_008344 [Venturia effusa]|uniref:Alpha-L-rhamnosidase n=1 Tax=Venturia effusa TaxID=50376 RepID=A0A517L9Q4_9PEZI|nr:hypothetical protein FKW77_008344 [Venturia effusa]
MSSPAWTAAAKWIWVPEFHDEVEKTPGKYCLFRKQFTLAAEQLFPNFVVHVSADSRYRLFVNGKSVAFGPCKSYPERWFYETVDISQHLVQGANVISARVLRYAYAFPGSSSIIRTGLPGFMLFGIDQASIISTDETWKCKEDTSTVLVPYSEWNYLLGPPFMANSERIYGDFIDQNWHASDLDESLWKPAVSQSLEVKMLPVLNPWKLAPRPIPALPETPKHFSAATKCTGSADLHTWKDFLLEDTAITVAANATSVVDVDASTLTTGFLSLRFRGGRGAKLRILCSEGYEKDLGVEKSPFPLPRGKSDRCDHISGRLYGTEDYFVVGSSSRINTFEPFWFRTFRYVQLQITSGEEELTLLGFDYRETHYPLEISTRIDVSNPEMESLWNISLNTLKNCMHETYEDCPFYEQNQFASDARLQMLFTYTLSSDDRLARKTLEEFHASRCADGLIVAQFPAGFKSFQIPQFSLYYILMVHDHMQYFGDKSLVKKYIGTIDGILNYFDSRLNGIGLVGQFDHENWAFVDWVDAWTTPRQIKKSCMPPAYWTVGIATVNSLLYATALLHAADIADFLGRCNTAIEYRQRAKDINDSANRNSFEDGIYTDGPGVRSTCQHTQVFAVLSGAISGVAATQLMERTLRDKDLPQCSYALKFYLFRALEKAGIYTSSFDAMMEPWRKMIGENLTTWAENDSNPRSDCHGWSASPIYEIVSGIFGLKPGAPGFQKVIIEPRMDLLDVAKARLYTRRGVVTVEWNTRKVLALLASSNMSVDIRINGSTVTRQLLADIRQECTP